MISTLERAGSEEYTSTPDRELFSHIKDEYLEMPCLRLTLEQAMRLFDVDRSTCSRAVNELVSAGFLMKDDTGRYAIFHGDH